MTCLLAFQLNQVSQLWVMTQPEDHPSSSTVTGGLNASSLPKEGIYCLQS